MTRGGLVGLAACMSFVAGLAEVSLAQNTSGAVTARIVRTGQAPVDMTFGAGAPIQITDIDDSVTQIRVYATAPGARTAIGPIHLAGPRFTQIPIDLHVGEGDGGTTTNAMITTPHAGDWTGLSLGETFKGYIRLNARVGGNITGPITAAEIHHLFVGVENRTDTGMIDAPITVRDGGGVGIRQLRAYSMTSNSRIDVLTGDIGEMIISCNKPHCGDMLGAINVPGGLIRSIEVGGAVGSAEHPMQIFAAFGVDFLICDQFTGTLDASMEGGKGWIKFFECRSGGFSGRMSAAGLGLSDPYDFSPRGVFIKGEFAGALEVAGNVNYDMRVGNFAQDSTITINGSLLARLISNSPTLNGDFGSIRIDTSIGPVNPEYNATIPIGIFAKGNIKSLKVFGTMVSPTTIATEVMISGASISELICHGSSRFDLSGPGEGVGIKIGSMRVGGEFAEGIWDIATLGEIDVDGDCGAQITVRNSHANSVIRVGGTLSGLFRAQATNGWRGQVIVNAANIGGTWLRAARIDRCPTCTIPIGPGAYPQTSQSLGGGSIGVVPFSLHDSDCLPRPNPSDPPLILDSEFKRPDAPGSGDKTPGLTLSFYGPVKEAGSGPLMRLFRILPLGEMVELTDQCNLRIGEPDAAGFSRDCVIGGKPDFFFAEGDYRIVVDASCSLACDGLLVTESVAVAPVAYDFRIGTDCDNNGVLDLEQIVSEPYADVNFDGFLDVCQRASGQLCVADFNLDGSVDGSDRELFEIVYEQGFAAADVNLDGGVDGSDFETFYRAFEIGC